MLEQTDEAVKLLENDGYSPMLVNLRFAKPLDREMINTVCEKCGYIFTVEDNVLEGGVGSTVLETANELGLLDKVKICPIAFPDRFIEHGTRNELYDRYGLSGLKIYGRIKERVENNG